MLYWLTKNLSYVLMRLYFGFKVTGLEKVPKKGPIILAANHSSMLDPVVVGAGMRRMVHYMAKEEVFKNPLAGWYLLRIGVFPVARGKGDRGAIRQALELLERGEALGIFPEGTRTTDGRLGKAQPGMAMIAAKSGATIVTAAIVNTFQAFPKGSKFPKPVRIEFRIGDVFTPQDLGFQGPGDTTVTGEVQHKGLDERREAREQMQRVGDMVMDSIRKCLEAR